MARRAVLLLIFVAVFAVGLVIFCIVYAGNAPSWTSYPANRHIFNTNADLSGAGTIYDRSGAALAKTVEGERLYHADAAVRKATLHAVGDLDGYIVTGLHSSYWDKLVGYNLVNGVFQPSGRGNDITLTLDAGLCVTALEALGRYSGTVGVYNYKTGELLCMVSTPTYDVNQKPDVDGDESGRYTGVYINRFLSSSFVPGSTFKLVTAAAALQTAEDMDQRAYTCHRGVEIDGEWVGCLGNHGTLTFREALAQSCNAYFAQLAVELGAETLTKTAERMGFNQAFDLDGIPAKKSTLDVSGIREIDLAWAGMGQYTTLANPLQYLTMMGAIANGGVPVKPYMVESITSPAGLPQRLRQGGGTGARMMTQAAADALKSMMRYTVSSNYGDDSFPGLNVCANTGTAEVAQGVAPHSWMVGFVQDEAYPYAFVVIAENAGSGSKTARTIANAVLQTAKEVR